VITLDVRGLETVQRQLRNLADEQMPYAMMLALNDTAFKVRAALQAEVKSVFDRPTPWLVNQVTVRKATKKDLTAIVGTLEGIKNQYGQNMGFSRSSSGVYERILEPHIQGGQRQQKKSELRLQRAGLLPSGWIMVPGPGMPLDVYGNPLSSELIMILSWLNAMNWSSQGASQNRAEKVTRRKNKAEKRGEEYFVIGRTSEKALGSSYLRPGVYKRLRDRRIKAMFFFVSKYAYKARLDWNGIARQTAEQELGPAMAVAMQRAIATAR